MPGEDAIAHFRLRVHESSAPGAGAIVEAALRGCDPRAEMTPDWPDRTVEIASRLPPQSFCAALLDAGSVAGVDDRATTRIGAGGAARLAGRTLLFGLLGAFAGAIAGLLAAIANLELSAACKTDFEGGCSMGAPLMVIGFAVIGGAAAGAAAAVVTLARGSFKLVAAADRDP